MYMLAMISSVCLAQWLKADSTELFLGCRAFPATCGHMSELSITAFVALRHLSKHEALTENIQDDTILMPKQQQW